MQRNAVLRTTAGPAAQWLLFVGLLGWCYVTCWAWRNGGDRPVEVLAQLTPPNLSSIVPWPQLMLTLLFMRLKCAYFIVSSAIGRYMNDSILYRVGLLEIIQHISTISQLKWHVDGIRTNRDDTIRGEPNGPRYEKKLLSMGDIHTRSVPRCLWGSFFLHSWAPSGTLNMLEFSASQLSYP
jgi:hypothetical protein